MFVTSALDDNGGVERDGFSPIGRNDNPHSPYAGFRKRNPAHHPSSVWLLGSGPFERLAARRGRIERNAYRVGGENSEKSSRKMRM